MSRRFSKPGGSSRRERTRSESGLGKKPLPRRYHDEDEDDEDYDDPKPAKKRVKSGERANGWAAVANRQKEMQKRDEERENSVGRFFLKEDEEATIQFLTDEPYCFDAHSVRDRSGNFSTVPCGLNTGKSCSLCKDGIKTTWRAAFKVLDFRGSWNRDKKRFNNDDPVVRIWTVGSTVAQQLKQYCDKKKSDLSELVIEVSRSGGGKDTTYNLETALDSRDRKIRPIDFDDETPDLKVLCAPPSEEDVERAGYYEDD